MPTMTRSRKMYVSESADKQQVAVSVRSTVAGNPDVVFFIYQALVPHVEGAFLRGEEYPSLVRAWDNDEDSTVVLYPLSFEEAMGELAHAPKHVDLRAEGSDNTTKPAPVSGPSKRRTAPHRKSSAD